MRTPDEHPKSGREALLAVASGTVGGIGGGLLLPGVMGFLGPATPLWGFLCFGSVGLLAGCASAVLCVHWEARGLGGVLLSLFVGVFAGLLATLPIVLALREYSRGLNALGHS
jgi:hypothetical protein